MQLKDFGLGALAMLMVCLFVGAAMAAIVPSGTGYSVQFYLNSSNMLRAVDAARYWQGNDSLTNNEGAAQFNSDVRRYIVEYITVAEKERAMALAAANTQGADIN